LDSHFDLVLIQEKCTCSTLSQNCNSDCVYKLEHRHKVKDLLYMTSFPASSSVELQECNCDNSSPCAVVLQHLILYTNCISAEKRGIIYPSLSLSLQVAITRQTTVVNSQGIKTPIQLHYAAQIEREEISWHFNSYLCVWFPVNY
jgi:hypothetical protein